MAKFEIRWKKKNEKKSMFRACASRAKNNESFTSGSLDTFFQKRNYV